MIIGIHSHKGDTLCHKTNKVHAITIHDKRFVRSTFKVRSLHDNERVRISSSINLSTIFLSATPSREAGSLSLSLSWAASCFLLVNIICLLIPVCLCVCCPSDVIGQSYREAIQNASTIVPTPTLSWHQVVVYVQRYARERE